MSAHELASGKSHRDENFPVASILIHPRYRSAILAFYRFARAADDVADNPTAPPEEKLRILDDMRASLAGESDVAAEAVALRATLAQRNLTAQHGLDLLEAFRRDVTKLRYANWDELMGYCRYSAMPVGRFVLDVHGEAHSTWPASDGLCAALQVINHLQDCGNDYRTLNRVYIPLDALAEAGAKVEALGEKASVPRLREAIAKLALRNADLLAAARPFASLIQDRRLALEVSVIQRLAEDLNLKLALRDPLSHRVHHSRPEALGLALSTTARFLLARFGRKRAAASQPPTP